MKVKFLSLILALIMLSGTVVGATSCDNNATTETESHSLQESNRETETGHETVTEYETETEPSSESVSEPDNDIATDSETLSQSASETESDTESSTQTEEGASSEDKSDSESESETQNDNTSSSETDTESETLTESENKTLTESESETVSETEAESDDATLIPNIGAEKTVSHSAGKTVYPGELITYSFVLKNSGNGKGTISISDTVPTNTSYVSGADKVDGSILSWSVTLAAGESKTINYTVQVNNDPSLCDGGTVTAGACKAGETDLTIHSLYIERTLNTTDQKFFDIAVEAMKKTEYYTDFNLYRWMYGVAFTYAQAVSGAISITNDTPESIMNAIANGTANEKVLDMVAPGLYGGSTITGAITGVKGTPNSTLTENDLISGDGILISQNGKTELFVYSNI